VFNLIEGFIAKQAIVNNYSDYIMVVKPFTSEGYYIMAVAKSN
jgi:hypothetical protein